MSYLTPLGNGVTRSKFDWWGWGAPDNAFWCCYGTTVETMAKLADSVFFQDSRPGNGTHSSAAEHAVGGAGLAANSPPPPPPRRLTVAQYIPAGLAWRAAGLEVRMQVTTTVSERFYDRVLIGR
jgi:hypothetical protein